MLGSNPDGGVALWFVSHVFVRPLKIYCLPFFSQMQRALSRRFHQHPDCMKALKDTGNSKLTFVDEGEPVWGFSMEARSGENLLGICLEQVRQQLRSG